MSKKKDPLVSFVVLNWNGLSDTKECLASIDKLTYKNKEVIVVDNGSEDGSKKYFRTLNNIEFIDLPENTGFTGGHIAGRKVAKGTYLAIINNDLVLDPKWVERCLETFHRHEDAAIVGGKAFKWNDTNPIYDPSNEYYSYQEVDAETGYTRTFLTGADECVVDSISGAALLIKQSCLEKIGYLDNRFFAYYEETDLIARLIRGGYRAYYNPEAATWHKVAGSSNGGESSAFYLYMMHRNRYIFAYKNLDEPLLTRFVRNYRKEYYSASLSLIKDRKNLDARSRVKAYRWVKRNHPLIQVARKEVQTLNGSYVSHLRESERKDVTVVIPCYNYGDHVAEAIDSVLNQSVLPKKIIIINDGSTDNSKEVIDSFKGNKLIEIVHKKNSGVIATKNLGISMSETYWTLFLDADDMLAKNFLAETLRMSGNGLKDIVYTDMRLFGAVNDIFRAKPFSVHTLLKTNYINNSALIKTTRLKQIGGYKTVMNHGLEDWELYISLIEAGAKPQYLPLALVKYRQHADSLSRNAKTIAREKDLIRQIKSLHKGFYRRHGYYKTVLLHGLKMLAYMVRYPSLVLVLLRAVPGGLKKALGHVYGQGLLHIQKRIGIVE